MTSGPGVAREQARRDVEDAVTRYLAIEDEADALDFIDALRRACGHIGRHPVGGSPRFAPELKLPSLRP